MDYDAEEVRSQGRHVHTTAVPGKGDVLYITQVPGKPTNAPQRILRIEPLTARSVSRSILTLAVGRTQLKKEKNTNRKKPPTRDNPIYLPFSS